MFFVLPPDTTHLPTRWGVFDIFTVPSAIPDFPQIVALNKILRLPNIPPLVRIHSECFTGDVLGSLRCDCNTQLHQSLKQIGSEGGILIYLRQEGRGSGLINKLKAYQLQDQGLDTVEAQEKLHLPIDSRDYIAAANILKNLKIDKIRLLTNNPEKVEDLVSQEITIVERLPLNTTPNQHNLRYLETKKNKLGHLLTFFSNEK